MGTFRHSIAIAARPEGPFRSYETLVDTGSLYTWIPRREVEALGVRPTGTRQFVLANGDIMAQDITEVVARLDVQSIHTICVFGDEGTAPLLGVYTLEGFALAVDPVNQRLVPMPQLPLLRNRS
ncbi:MAG: hypothetical protein HY689_10660 [Chloroflexi bacterium]|nr:hypothetical protein [Chloroflexota bacterium]